MSGLSVQLSESSDAAVESSPNAVNVRAGTLDLAIEGGWYWFRFQNVTIPEGATIGAAP